MGCCCNNTYNFGCLKSCGYLGFGEVAESGVYYGVFTFAGISSTQSITLSAGDAFRFDLSLLNEVAEYKLQIFDSLWQPVKVELSGIEYDCFVFNTNIYGHIIDITEEVEDLDILLQENGDAILQENGSYILL